MEQNNTVINLIGFVADRTMSMLKENTVLGQPIERDGITVIPVSKLSVSFAGGGADIADIKKKKKQNSSGGGAKVDLVPLSFLVISGTDAKVIKVEASENSTAAQVIDFITNSAKKLFNKNTANK